MCTIARVRTPTLCSALNREAMITKAAVDLDTETPPHLTTTVSARLPVEVAATWRAAAFRSGLSMSDWLRQAIDPDAVRIVDYRRPQPRRRFSPVDPALLLSLARIGANCNQIAHSIHTNALRSERIDALRFLQVLLKIQRELASIAQVRRKD